MLLCIAPFLLLVFLTLASRLIYLPAVSERTLSSAAIYSAPVCGLIGALVALNAANGAQAAVFLVAGIVVLVAGKATSQQKRADGLLARIALLALAANLATTGQPAAYLLAAAIALLGLALPSLLRRLPEIEEPERPQQPEITESSTAEDPVAVVTEPTTASARPPEPSEPQVVSGQETTDWTSVTLPSPLATLDPEPAEMQPIAPLTLEADDADQPASPEPAPLTEPETLAEVTVEPQPQAEAQPITGFSRRRSAHLLDQPDPNPVMKLAAPQLLGDGQFKRLRRAV